MHVTISDKTAHIFSLSILVVIVAIPARQLYLWHSAASLSEAAPTAAAARVERVPDVSVTVDRLVVKRDRAPQLAILEFSDYQCPFCGQYVRELFPSIEKAFIDTGIVAYAFVDLPLQHIHPMALQAAIAAQCAGRQGRFWQMHDDLFEHQRGLTTDVINGQASSVGLDMTAFKGCIGKGAGEELQQAAGIAARLGVISTPTFAVGIIQPDGAVKVSRKINDARDIGTFQAVIDDLKSMAGDTHRS